VTAAIRQQINLYQPIFSEESKRLSAGTVAVLLGVIAIAMTGFSVHTRMRLNGLEAEVATLRAQQSEREALLSAADGLSPEERTARVTASIRELEGSLEVRSHALQILQSGAAGQTNGFAARLEALARRHVEGVWIDALLLSGTTPAMAVHGATSDPDIVPRYLASLAHDPVLSGTRFDDFIIEREKAESTRKQSEDEGETAKHADKHPIEPHRSPRFLRFRAGSSALMAESTPEPTT
jgi:hypothetical protein